MTVPSRLTLYPATWPPVSVEAVQARSISLMGPAVADRLVGTVGFCVSGGGVTTWSKATATAAASGAGMAEIWYGAVTSAATVLTVTLSGSTNWQLADLAEYSGINTTSPLDGATGTTGSASSFTAGPITTTSAGDLVVTDVWTGVANSASTVGPSTPGYTVLSETKANGSFYRGWAAYQVVGAAGSQSAAWIQPSSISGTYATAIAAFKP